MFIATAPACSLDRFIVQADSLPLPGAAHLALQRVCFDPAAFTPGLLRRGWHGAARQLAARGPKRLGSFWPAGWRRAVPCTPLGWASSR